MSIKSNFKSLAIWAILVIIVLIPFFLFEESINFWIESLLQEYSGNTFAVGLILFTVLASDIFLPIPSCLLGAMCGLFLGPFIGFFVSFSAMTVSGLTGFYIGRTASSLACRMMGETAATLDSFKKSNPFIIFIFRPVPVLSECSCIYAGFRRYNFTKTVFWMLLGNAVVSAVYSVIGHLGRDNATFFPAFIAVVLLSGFSFLVGKIIPKSRRVF